MQHIGIADLLRSIVRLEIVVALGQAEAALEGIAQHALRIVIVTLRTKIEHEGHALSRIVAYEIGDFIGRVQAVDALEIILDRRVAGFFHGGIVHARAVEITDLLFDRARCIFCLSRVLGDPVLGNQ